MKLIASPTSPFSRKVRIVLAEKRIDYDFVVARSQLAQALPEPRQAVRKIAATRAIQGHGAAESLKDEG